VTRVLFISRQKTDSAGCWQGLVWRCRVYLRVEHWVWGCLSMSHWLLASSMHLIPRMCLCWFASLPTLTLTAPLHWSDS